MAQLRDANTSAHLADGTPEELVLVAEQVGRDRVLFDGVGEGFNPDAVLQAYRENMAGLQGGYNEEQDSDAKASLKAAVDQAQQVEANAQKIASTLQFSA